MKAISDDEARRIQEMLELQAGLRCGGCGRRIALGVRGLSIDPRDGQSPVVQRYACLREDCEEAKRVRDDALAMEMIEFAWPNGGIDAPAAEVVVTRNERRRKRSAHT